MNSMNNNENSSKSENNNVDITQVMNILSKMDKKELEDKMALAQQILKAKGLNKN